MMTLTTTPAKSFNHALRRKLFAMLVLALLTLPLTAASEAFDYRLKPQQVADGVYVLIGLTEDFSRDNGGNIVNTGFIVGSEGVIVIDTGPSRRYGEQMVAAIRSVTSLPIVLTLNTHHHPDHFLGNQAFPEASLAALAESIAGIKDEGEGFNDNMYRLNGDWMRDTRVVTPGTEIQPGRSLIAGRDIEMLALRGHTAADLVVIDHHSGTVFASDLLFFNRAPTTPHADIAAWLDALSTLETLPAKQWVPGHGPVATDLAPLHQTRAYLTWLSDTIQSGAEGGMDMAEMLEIPIPDVFTPLDGVATEYRRSVIHLFPAAELAAFER